MASICGHVGERSGSCRGALPRVAFGAMSPRLLLASFALALPALATPPSEPCREGAVVCRDAYVKLEKCEQGNPDAPDACGAERLEAERACMQTTGACHTDGSRFKP